MSHANAVLSLRTRLRLCNWSWRRANPQQTFPGCLWSRRSRSQTGMQDRSSRPHRSPHRTSDEMKRKIVALRWQQRLGPVQIAAAIRLASSTVYAVLARCRVNGLCRIDRVTGESLRLNEHPHAASMLHVDVTKFGNILACVFEDLRAYVSGTCLMRDSLHRSRLREGAIRHSRAGPA